MRTDHGLCTVLCLQVGNLIPKIEGAFAYILCCFWGEKASSFPHFCGFPFSCSFTSTMVVPFCGMTLVSKLWLCPFICGTLLRFFMFFVCLFFCVSGEYCYSGVMFFELMDRFFMFLFVCFMFFW